jgi:hypothetical protein
MEATKEYWRVYLLISLANMTPPFFAKKQMGKIVNFRLDRKPYVSMFLNFADMVDDIRFYVFD